MLLSVLTSVRPEPPVSSSLSTLRRRCQCWQGSVISSPPVLTWWTCLEPSRPVRPSPAPAAWRLFPVTARWWPASRPAQSWSVSCSAGELRTVLTISTITSWHIVNSWTVPPPSFHQPPRTSGQGQQLVSSSQTWPVTSAGWLSSTTPATS